MTRVKIDEALRKKLQNLTEPLEFYDDSGRVLGRFLPAFDPTEYEGLESPLSREELQRRKLTKSKSYSTEEVLDQLEKL